LTISLECLPAPAISGQCWFIEHARVTAQRKDTGKNNLSNVSGISVKVAVTVLSLSIVIWQSPVPEQAPLHPLKVEPSCTKLSDIVALAFPLCIINQAYHDARMIDFDWTRRRMSSLVMDTGVKLIPRWVG
jgi:hypothetical protein